MSNNKDNIKGIDRLWFLIVFTSLFVFVSIFPDWDALLNEMLKFFWPGIDAAKNDILKHSFVSITLQILIWNFLLAIVTAPVFYLRIINIRLGNKWILALIIPFVWSVLLIRCLVYQPGYTHSGKLDGTGKKILKVSNYVMYAIFLLSVTYLLADYF